ncbi:hypothetical protein FJT64_017329 [Amphibalanus amphitrite]|nr:hypothetical protein FJT64_017329 [Amphibalanus amphitrite]
MCSSNATNEHISIRFLWQPFFDQHFLKALQTFVDECQQPRGTCPDMVLVNGGFWYSGRVPGMDKIAQHEQLTMLRQGVLRAAPALARLARRTLTLWKLEEAMLFEFVPDKYRLRLSKVEYMELLLVQQALIYELTLQVPELVIWSSLLPEVTRHMFHVCARRADRDNCPDPVHMGRSLQSGFSDTLMAVLCRRATAPRR